MPYEFSFGANTGASAWKQMEAWRAKRKEQHEEFANAASLLTGSLNNANANMIQQSGIIAAQVALKRLQDANAAKAAKQAALNSDETASTGFSVQDSIAERYRDLALSSVNVKV